MEMQHGEKRRVKIISDGGQFGTKVVDAATGEPIDGNIRKVLWTHRAGEPPICEVTLILTQAEVESEAIAVSGLVPE